MRKALGPRGRLVSRKCEGGAMRGEGLATDMRRGCGHMKYLGRGWGWKLEGLSPPPL